MADKILKNIEFEKALEMATLVAYQEGQIVSRTLVQNKAVSITRWSTFWMAAPPSPWAARCTQSRPGRPS